MRHFAIGFAAVALLACGAATVFPDRSMAFEVQQGAVTTPGGSTQYSDPDETLAPATPASPMLNEDSSGLALTPGAGTDLGSGFSLQMAPSTEDTGNPADNKALIPGPL